MIPPSGPASRIIDVPDYAAALLLMIERSGLIGRNIIIHLMDKKIANSFLNNQP
jgi:hypothetical protein